MTGLNRGRSIINYNEFGVHVTSENFQCFSKAINSRLTKSSIDKCLSLGLCRETVKGSCFQFCSAACSPNTTVTICTMASRSSLRNGILFLTGILLTLFVTEYFSIMTSKSDPMTSPPIRSHDAILDTWAMTQPMNSSVSCNISVFPNDGRGYRRRIPQAIVIGVMKGGTGMLCNSLSLYHYYQFSNIRRIQSQNINVSRLVVQLTLPNPLKPDVKLRMEM